MESIYLDHAAASPFHPKAIEAFAQACGHLFANASAPHMLGQRAEHALHDSRERIAMLIGAKTPEIIFTANSTEANNLAIRGAALHARKAKNQNHIVVADAQHPAVEATVKDLVVNYGFEMSKVPVDSHGMPLLDELKNLITPSTALVTLIYGNNEVGSLAPIGQCAQTCQQKNVLLHVDASQSCAWQKIDANELGVDLLSASGRKMGAPGGGFLFKRSGVPLQCTLTGGGQEHSLRSGTPHIPEIVALATAFEVRMEQIKSQGPQLKDLRDSLIQTIVNTIRGCVLTGSATQRLLNHASFAFTGLEGNALCRRLDLCGYAVSPGAACKTGNPAPSEILRAMGFSDELAMGGLRVSLGFETTKAQLESFVKVLQTVVEQLRTDLSHE